MNLLTSAIKEYLAENHRLWNVVRVHETGIHIERSCTQITEFIAIYYNENIITTRYFAMEYTEYTILQQITEAINELITMDLL